MNYVICIVEQPPFLKYLITIYIYIIYMIILTNIYKILVIILLFKNNYIMCERKMKNIMYQIIYIYM